MGELLLRMKRFYRWTDREKRDILITIIALTFIFGYNDCTKLIFNDCPTDFVLVRWLVNMLLTLLLVTISFFAYDFGMKVSALQQGFIAEYKMWPPGIALGIIVTLLTKGNFYILLIGGLFLHHHSILRLGKFRYGINIVAQGTIAAAGPFANLMLMTFGLLMSKQLMILPDLFLYFAFINGTMMIFQLLPIPKTNGFHLFFSSRLGYMFVFGTMVCYVLLAIAGVFSWLLALLLGGLIWFLWYWFVEGGKV